MRDKMLRVRFSEVEFAALKALAAESRMSMSDLVREAVLPGPSFEERLVEKLVDFREVPNPLGGAPIRAPIPTRPSGKRTYSPDPR